MSAVMTDARASADLDTFRALFGQHPAGVCVITAEGDDGPVAMTATSVISVSADPPLVAFSVSDLSSSAATLHRVDRVVIHFLSADNIDLAKLGATSGVDRFADKSLWSRLPDGEPYYINARAIAVGDITERVVAGTATLTVAHIREVIGTDTPGAPLVYHSRSWHRLGEASLHP